MGVVVEYSGCSTKPGWVPLKLFRWNYSRFATGGSTMVASPDETFEMLIAKDNAAENGFNRWTMNGDAFRMNQGIVPASFH